MIDTYLNQQVQRKAKTGFDGYGKPTLGTATTISARFVEGTRRVKKSDGTEYIVDGELWVKPTQTIALDDIIVISSVNYKVMDISSPRTLDGAVNHKKALLQKTKE